MWVRPSCLCSILFDLRSQLICARTVELGGKQLNRVGNMEVHCHQQRHRPSSLQAVYATEGEAAVRCNFLARCSIMHIVVLIRSQSLLPSKKRLPLFPPLSHGAITSLGNIRRYIRLIPLDQIECLHHLRSSQHRHRWPSNVPLFRRK